MSPRPQKASDEQILAGAQRAMMRLGPHELTLAEIAAEAGITAGAIVQRFGSKRKLMLALAEAGIEWPRYMFRQLREEHDSPLAGLRAYSDCMAGLAESPSGLAHHLSYLQIDLTDEEFHKHTQAMARVTHEELRSLVEAAVTAGELRSCTESDALARAVGVTLNGSMLAWAFFREGPAAAWMRHDLELVLRPYLRIPLKPRPRRTRRKARPSRTLGRGR